MVATALSVIFFLSGVTALLFENLWFYQAGITFGNSVWASSLVLAGFMGGLALGNVLAARLRPGGFRAIRVYAMLELAIGIFGLALVVSLPSLTPLLAIVFEPVLSIPWVANPLRLGFAFLLLLVPSTAMGATLPVMVSALYRRDPRFGSVLGRLYGWNTLGAVVGAVAGEVVLIEALGVRGTGLAAAGISVSVAILAFVLSRRFESGAPAVESVGPPSNLSANARWLLAAAAIAGFSLLGLEVVWFRFLLHFVFGSSAAFAILLATILAGIGIGGLVGGYVASSEGRAQRLLPGTAMLTGAVCLVLYLLYPSGPAVTTWNETALLALSLTFAVAFLSGVLFTLLGEALHKEEERETRAAALLALSNTTGAMAGPLLVGFVLLPMFGVDRSLQVLASLYLLIGVLTLTAGARPKRRAEIFFTCAAGASLVIAIFFVPVGDTLERHLRPVIDTYSRGGAARPVAMREGVSETIVYMEEKAFGEPVSYRMLTNGYSMSATTINGQRYMKLFVYLPMALNPDAKTALLISYGVGSTAKALTNTAGLESIDVVDISRGVLEMNDIVYPDKGTLPLEDPRVRVHIEDGRYFLQTTKKRFDLITGEPPPPKMAGIVGLYTREYFSLIHERLLEGGIVSYWLPAHSLAPDDSKSIIRAFCDVFDDCTLWGGAGLDWILLGTRNATGPGSAERFARQWVDPVVGPELNALGIERPEQLGALFMSGADGLNELAGDTAALIDDRPKRLSDRLFDPQASLPAYAPWMDTTSARIRFEQSTWIQRIWPSELRVPTLSYFPIQSEINRVLASGPRQLQAVLPTIHSLLTQSDLTTLPLWLMVSDEPHQLAAKSALEKGKSEAEVYWELALGALAGRNYARAYELFVRVAQAGARGPSLRALTLYSGFMASDQEGQHALLRELTSVPSAPSAEPWLLRLLQQAVASR